MDRMRDVTISSDINESLHGSSKGKISSSSPTGSGVLPPRTINPEQEDEIVKQLELEQRQRLEADPMKELNEALMDRTTAGKNRKKQQIMTIKCSNSSAGSDKQYSSDKDGSMIDVEGE